MHRVNWSPHIAIAAVVMAGGCTTPLLWLIPALVRAARNMIHANVPHSFMFESISVNASLALLCFWGIATSVGLILGRPRARRSAVALSIFTLTIELPLVIVFVGFAVSEGGLFSRGTAGIMVELIIPALIIPVWWLWLFTRPAVKSRFATFSGVNQSASVAR